MFSELKNILVITTHNIVLATLTDSERSNPNQLREFSSGGDDLFLTGWPPLVYCTSNTILILCTIHTE